MTKPLLEIVKGIMAGLTLVAICACFIGGVWNFLDIIKGNKSVQPFECPKGYYLGYDQIGDGTCIDNKTGRTFKCLVLECNEYLNI